jgi:hypothetical protein
VVTDPHQVVPLTGAITSHGRHLFDQVLAYAAKDCARAHEREMEGYQQMIGVAGTLVAAIQRTLQPRLPVGGAGTGRGRHGVPAAMSR